MNTENFDFIKALQNRTKSFAIRIIRLCRSLPKTTEAYIVQKQILRSATAIAANYRAACRARSNSEFYSKICIVVEETDETMFWLEILQEAEIVKAELLTNLYKENEEILKIMVTAKEKSKKEQK
ncbi:MAG: four helix bundle protein [Prevotellaceae bacterium]|jgi:four helix bundle protein|nr:four helix bundle protein [Prevotellaceae bacterium]